MSHSSGHYRLRFALAVWLATVFSLLATYLLQLEPAQWSAITVWIVFIQLPTMNYSKIIWWGFGVTVGAAMAVALIVLLSQAPELLLLSLALWLSVCAGASTFARGYKDYGAVLAGYTCAVVTMSAAATPELIFRLAVTRVLCITIGMAVAIIVIVVMLPHHRHWRRTVQQLGEHLGQTVSQAAAALGAGARHPDHFTWRHIVNRLGALEHTLDATTAESPESRRHAAGAASMVAALLSTVTDAQSIEIHLARSDAGPISPNVHGLFTRATVLLRQIAEKMCGGASQSAGAQVNGVLAEMDSVRHEIDSASRDGSCTVSGMFILARLDGLLSELSIAIKEWTQLTDPSSAAVTSRSVSLIAHRDYKTALIFGLRMFLAIVSVSLIWMSTEWPSASQAILFVAVVCSLLSLLERAPILGWDFLKSAFVCFVAAFFYSFWLLQHAEGFVLLAAALGLFLIPAGYVYQTPSLRGSAVVSLFLFYGLTSPSNQMSYDISIFLNNGLALLAAASLGFFAFHAVPSLTTASKRSSLLHAIRHDVVMAGLQGRSKSTEGWTSLMFDRLRILHRNGADINEENEALLNLQLGLCQRRLRTQLEADGLAPNAKAVGLSVLREFRKVSRQPISLAASHLKAAQVRLQETTGAVGGALSPAAMIVLAELSEMTHLAQAERAWRGR